MPSYISAAVVPDHDGHLRPTSWWMLTNTMSQLMWAARTNVSKFGACFCFENPTISEMSSWVSSTKEVYDNQRHLLLNNETVLRKFPMRKSHSHGVAAVDRTAMNAYMMNTARHAGFDPYNVSKSAQDKDSSGSRLYFSHKDTNLDYCDDKVTQNTCFVMTDVDYYVDINGYLKAWKPIMMYTLKLTRPVGRHEDYAFRVVDGEVEFKVAGGSSYKHQVWNYTGDCASVVDKWGRLCVFNLEIRDIPDDEHHQLVVFTPSTRIPAPWYWYMEDPLVIKRKYFGDSGVNVDYEPITDTVCLAKNGSWHSVELRGNLFDSIKSRLDNKEAPAVVSDVERLLSANRHPNATADAPLLYEMMQAKLEANVVKTNGAIAYQPLGSLATEDGKVPGRAVTTQLVSEGAVFAVKGQNSDEATIDGRINKPRNDVVPPQKYANFAAEFVKLVVPDDLAATGIPLEIAEVRNRQCNPMQIARYDKVKDTMTDNDQNRLKCFIKSEAYNSVNDPRNITTMSPEVTTNMSAYTLAFKEQVLKKKIPWYGPGMNPKETIERLRLIGDKRKDFLTIDYSRLDGSISKFLQVKIARAAYMRWCHQKYRPGLGRYFDEVFKRRAVTTNGLSFDPGYGTRSGSPITTDANTMMCAFVVYSALRELGYTPEEAFRMVDLVYGDDGVQCNVDGLEQQMRHTCKAIGLKIKMDVVARGEQVAYCGRVFIDPTTTGESFQDPLRTLMKLHLTANKSVTREQAAANKAAGYWATDSLTPLVGTWAKRVMEITGLNLKSALGEETFKISNAWPQTDPALIEENVAKVLGLSVPELRKLDNSIRIVKALDEFPVVISTQLETKISAVVGDEIRHPGNLSIDKKDEQQPTTTERSVPQVDANSLLGSVRPDPTTVSKTRGVRPEAYRARNVTTQTRPRTDFRSGSKTGRGSGGSRPGNYRGHPRGRANN